MFKVFNNYMYLFDHCPGYSLILRSLPLLYTRWSVFLSPSTIWRFFQCVRFVFPHCTGIFRAVLRRHQQGYWCKLRLNVAMLFTSTDRFWRNFSLALNWAQSRLGAECLAFVQPGRYELLRKPMFAQPNLITAH